MAAMMCNSAMSCDDEKWNGALFVPKQYETVCEAFEAGIVGIADSLKRSNPDQYLRDLMVEIEKQNGDMRARLEQEKFTPCATKNVLLRCFFDLTWIMKAAGAPLRDFFRTFSDGVSRELFLSQINTFETFAQSLLAHPEEALLWLKNLRIALQRHPEMFRGLIAGVQKFGELFSIGRAVEVGLYDLASEWMEHINSTLAVKPLPTEKDSDTPMIATHTCTPLASFSKPQVPPFTSWLDTVCADMQKSLQKGPEGLINMLSSLYLNASDESTMSAVKSFSESSSYGPKKLPVDLAARMMISFLWFLRCAESPLEDLTETLVPEYGMCIPLLAKIAAPVLVHSQVKDSEHAIIAELAALYTLFGTPCGKGVFNTLSKTIRVANEIAHSITILVHKTEEWVAACRPKRIAEESVPILQLVSAMETGAKPAEQKKMKEEEQAKK